MNLCTSPIQEHPSLHPGGIDLKKKKSSAFCQCAFGKISGICARGGGGGGGGGLPYEMDRDARRLA